MKKAFFLIFLVFLPFLAYSADFSLNLGGGGLLGYTFTRYTLEGAGAESKQKMDRLNYGGFIFFDATYMEFSVSLQGGKSSYSEKMASGSFVLTDGSGKGSELNIGIMLLGKYPIKLHEKITIFPLFGLEYNITLIQKRTPEGRREYNRSKGELVEDRDKNDKPYDIFAWNAFFIDVGAGLDYKFSNSLFLRGEFIYNFRLPTGYESGSLEMLKKRFNIDNPKLAGLTSGPNFKIGLGYSF